MKILGLKLLRKIFGLEIVEGNHDKYGWSGKYNRGKILEILCKIPAAENFRKKFLEPKVITRKEFLKQNILLGVIRLEKNFSKSRIFRKNSRSQKFSEKIPVGKIFRKKIPVGKYFRKNSWNGKVIGPMHTDKKNS